MDNKGSTPLHWAAYSGYILVINNKCLQFSKFPIDLGFQHQLVGFRHWCNCPAFGCDARQYSDSEEIVDEGN